ncbi:MAG: hypothetical protein EOP48_11285 [Sphingobacteriales bacterium]|nr:MAG: hypothetical protein EOP48_11285 [Sphingobacteriales bacterium]
MFKIVFNEESLTADDGYLYGDICIVVEGISFPGLGWNDFVGRILDWWLQNFSTLVKDDKVYCEFLFMDGTFEFIVSGNGNELTITLNQDEKDVSSYVISRKELLNELRNALELILRWSSNNRYANSPDIVQLKQ